LTVAPVINLGRRDLLATHLVDDLGKLGRLLYGDFGYVARENVGALGAWTGDRCWPRVRCGARSTVIPLFFLFCNLLKAAESNKTL